MQLQVTTTAAVKVLSVALIQKLNCIPFYMLVFKVLQFSVVISVDAAKSIVMIEYYIWQNAHWPAVVSYTGRMGQGEVFSVHQAPEVVSGLRELCATQVACTHRCCACFNILDNILCTFRDWKCFVMCVH